MKNTSPVVIQEIPKLFAKGHIQDPKKLPHQKTVEDLFVIHQIGEHRSISWNGRVNRFFKNSKRKYKQMSKKSPAVSYIAMAAFMMFSVALFDTGGNLFKASLTDKVPAFNGMVYPFEKSPSWFKTGGKNTRLFSSYSAAELTPAPRYDAKLMQKEEWSKKVVDPKITYSIVYMGQYKYNHIENKGSHPGVDIKLPKGTPILSISNGVVTKALSKTTGYGKHVVVKHTGVPEYGTLYSSYSHMSKMDVKVGQVVLKGQKIGEVGSTGNSTTAHIHFQLDRGNAPFHPYWPFAWAEVQAAGVSYTEAVNIGLGKANGLKYTVNPFTVIHKYQNYTGGSTSTKATPAKTAPAKTEPLHAAPTATTAEKAPAIGGGATVLKAFEISASPNKILEGDTTEIKIIALNEKKARIRDFNESVELTYTDGDDSKKLFVKLKSGIITKSIVLKNKGRVNFRVKFDKTFQSTSVTVKKRTVVTADTSSTGKAENFDSFKISGEKAVRERESISLIVRALDKNGNAIASDNFPAKGAYTISTKNGVVSPNKILKGDLQAGELTFRFKGKKRGSAWVKIGDEKFDITVLQTVASQEMVDAKSTDSQVPAASTSPTGKKIFTDVYSSHKHSEAISYLKAHNIINGYDNGSFRPEKTVSRAEAIKMIFSAFDIKGNSNIDTPFGDVANNEWFSPFVLAAYDLDIVGGYADGSFKPAKTVNRSEYFKIFLSSADVVLPKTTKTKPFADTEKDAWFAPYAAFAKEEDLLEFGNNFAPTKDITRAEVAETIYRLLK